MAETCNAIFDTIAFLKPDGIIIHSFAKIVNQDADSRIGKKCYQIVYETDSFIERMSSYPITAFR
ncbi:hypothetical protein TdN_04040 [Thermodesulfovibrio sp. TK110]